MDKEVVCIYVCVCVCVCVCAIIKKEILPFAMTWMELECIMLSEIGQREKNAI